MGRLIESIPCCPYGFGASPGWDPATGLGSPNFEVLAALVLNNESFFPNLGAYPDGQSVLVQQADDSQDDDEGNDAEIGKILGIIAVVLSVIGLIVMAVLYMTYFKKAVPDRVAEPIVDNSSNGLTKPFL